MHPSSATEAENKALIRRWFEAVWNKGQVELIDQLRAPDAVAVGLGEGKSQSRGDAPFKLLYSNLRRLFPDLRVKIEDRLAEDDKVAVRLTFEGTHRGNVLGVAPSGRCVVFSGIVIARIAGGKIVEAWNSLDQLALLRQIGVLQAEHCRENFLITRA